MSRRARGRARSGSNSNNSNRTRKQTFSQRLRGFLFTCGIFGLILFYWLVAFYATDWFYSSLDKRPHEVFVQLINSIGGMLLWGLTMTLLGKYFRSKQMDFFQALIDAIRSMSRGDFNVSVENNSHSGPFVELVDSINHMAVELGQLEKMRQEFISNVSHEIQSPLTSISGFSRALRNDRITLEERTHYLEIIEAESNRLSKLSDNLLKLSSLESQHHPFEPKSFRLDKQLRNHILACEPQWVDKAIEMDIDLAEVNVTADEDLLNQVWTNLIHNAIKFAPQGGTIGVHLRRNEGEAIVRISDNGIGVPDADQAHIFERFYKVDKSRNRTSGGSGLGLSIVKKIIEMHQGSVSVKSQQSVGTTFTVCVPLTE
ncbi:two-component sensor histidine kinase [Paenibacillus sp. SYP-B3998]|uniref:histidine kinase n=1 Tax=Paenibacillus sp. SYP-B3998 TaxID=2678564 RepID=A0A6G3ZZC1_9BACL|nr:HAMP domain-containing sensor histidine kinase [Paenibacillus sp. SYP-B3998]NEW07482.1 two-component sensor histidine kinase [Paenibacillus sp. SYP-B3998]